MNRITKAAGVALIALAMLFVAPPAQAAPAKSTLKIQLEKSDGSKLYKNTGYLRNKKAGRTVVLSAWLEQGKSRVSGASVQFQQRDAARKIWVDIGPPVKTDQKIIKKAVKKVVANKKKKIKAVKASPEVLGDPQQRARLIVQSLETTEYRAVFLGNSKNRASNSGGIKHKINTDGMHKANCARAFGVALPCNARQKHMQKAYNSMQSLSRDASVESSVRSLTLLVAPSRAVFDSASLNHRSDRTSEWLQGKLGGQTSVPKRVSCFNAHLNSYMIESIANKRAIGNATSAISLIEGQLTKKSTPVKFKVSIKGKKPYYITSLSVTTGFNPYAYVGAKYAGVVKAAVGGAVDIKTSRDIDAFLMTTGRSCGINGF